MLFRVALVMAVASVALVSASYGLDEAQRQQQVVVERTPLFKERVTPLGQCALVWRVDNPSTSAQTVRLAKRRAFLALDDAANNIDRRGVAGVVPASTARYFAGSASWLRSSTVFEEDATDTRLPLYVPDAWASRPCVRVSPVCRGLWRVDVPADLELPGGIEVRVSVASIAISTSVQQLRDGNSASVADEWVLMSAGQSALFVSDAFATPADASDEKAQFEWRLTAADSPLDDDDGTTAQQHVIDLTYLSGNDRSCSPLLATAARWDASPPTLEALVATWTVDAIYRVSVAATPCDGLTFANSAGIAQVAASRTLDLLLCSTTCDEGFADDLPNLAPLVYTNYGGTSQSLPTLAESAAPSFSNDDACDRTYTFDLSLSADQLAAFPTAAVIVYQHPSNYTLAAQKATPPYSTQLRGWSWNGDVCTSGGTVPDFSISLGMTTNAGKADAEPHSVACLFDSIAASYPSQCIEYVFADTDFDLVNDACA